MKMFDTFYKDFCEFFFIHMLLVFLLHVLFDLVNVCGQISVSNIMGSPAPPPWFQRSSTITVFLSHTSAGTLLSAIWHPTGFPTQHMNSLCCAARCASSLQLLRPVGDHVESRHHAHGRMLVPQSFPPLCCHEKHFWPATLKGTILHLQYGSNPCIRIPLQNF